MNLDLKIRQDVNDTIVDYAESAEAGLLSAVFGPDTDTFAALSDVEKTLFPEIVDLPPGNYAFWAIMQGGRVLHAMRLSFPTVCRGLLAPFQIHELIRSGQRTARQFAEEYEERGHILAHLISAETHFRVEDKADYPSPVGLPSYLGLIAYCERTHRTGVLGHLNAISKHQFREAGFLVEPASIHADLYTPALDDPSIMDVDYTPMLMPIRGRTKTALKLFADLVPKHVETYVDLRSIPEVRSTSPSSVLPIRL